MRFPDNLQAEPLSFYGFGNNTTPSTGDPEYSGEFIVMSYRPTLATGSAVTFEAQLVPATGTAPSWGTMS